MSYIPLTAERLAATDDKRAPIHAYPVDDTDYEVQHRRDTEMAEFLIEIICEYSVGTVYGEPDDKCGANFTHDIHRYADRYRCDRYGFVKNQQFIRDLYESPDCKRLTVLKCNLFLNGLIVFEDVVEFVNEWGNEDVVVAMDKKRADLEMTKFG
jgi:hypothetical protein